MRTRRRAGWRVRVIVSAVLGCLFGAGFPASAGEDRFSASMAEDLAREIQAFRQASNADPEAVRQLRWDRWDAREVHCRSTLWSLLEALSANECGGEVMKVIDGAGEFATALYAAAMSPQGSVPDATWKGLEATAQTLGFPAEAAACIARTYVRFCFPPGPLQDDWLEKTRAVTDAVNLVMFLKNLHTMGTKGFTGLGDTTGERVAEGVGTATDGITQSKGWFESMFSAAESFYLGRVAADTLRLRELDGSLSQCKVEGARERYEAITKDALEYVVSTREWVTGVEHYVYCRIPSPAGRLWDSSETTLKGLAPELQNDLASANFLERKAVSHYYEIESDGRFTEAAIDAKRAELERLMAELTKLPRLLTVVMKDCGSDEALADLDRALELENGSECFHTAWERAGLQGTPAAWRETVRQYVTARNAFFREAEEIQETAMPRVEQCRFREAEDLVVARCNRFDERWTPYTFPGFRKCWAPPRTSAPWPLDALQEMIRRRQEEIDDALAAAGDSFELSRPLRGACRWAEAQDALDSARDRLGRIAAMCSETSEAMAKYAAEMERLGRLETELRDERQTVQPLIDATERAARDLLHEMEVDLYNAEDPANPQRCEAAERVIQAQGRADTIRPPQQCGSMRNDGFVGGVQEKVERAKAAKTLGLEAFDRHLSFAGMASEQCDQAALAANIAAIEAIPEPCGRDRAAALESLRRRDQEIQQQTDAFRANIPVYEQEWAAAWGACDLAELTSLANNIRIWGQNQCAIENISDGERGRVDALKAHTPEAVMGVARMTNEARDGLRAKLDLARGYIRTLGTVVGQQYDAAYYREHIERHIEGARNLVAYIKTFRGPDLPPECYQDLVQEIAGLRPELEGLIAAIGPPANRPERDDDDAPDTEPTPTASEEGEPAGGATTEAWTAAAAGGMVTSTSSTDSEPGEAHQELPPAGAAGDPDVAARADRAADRARRDKERQRQTARAVAESLGGILNDAGQAKQAGANLPGPAGKEQGTQGRGGGQRCVIEVFNTGSSAVWFLVEAPGVGSAPWGFIAWRGFDPEKDGMKKECSTPRDCLQLHLSQTRGGARILPGSYGNLDAALDAARKKCPNPIVPIKTYGR